MAKIIVFDSGFGSLSIIKPIQKTMKSDIIYFADQKNFPYGKKIKVTIEQDNHENDKFARRKIQARSNSHGF